MLRNSCIQARERLTRQGISKSRFLEVYPRLLLRNFRSKTYFMAKLTKNVLLISKTSWLLRNLKDRFNLGADHLSLEGGGGWFLVIKNIFFLAIWWAGYFFPFFSLKLFITFVLHAIFFFRQALAGNFFSKSPTPFPPQELHGRPLIHRTLSVIYVHLTCVLQGRAKIVSFRLGY